MGHTVYYRIKVERWGDFRDFLKRICEGLGYTFIDGNDSVLVIPDCSLVEPLEIKKDGEGFSKTNFIEPCHSIYLLILHSVSSFGSVSVWED
ncbi:TonB-dependent receptor [Thermococcus siculi]|uniref:TonB-dependent receptor n=1 Tax=Thermococcus siculi TaxID=72803 RepID=A0A2Z2MP27_9EURY|nr:TonB-dependent receptor [Thermococcus siculi]